MMKLGTPISGNPMESPKYQGHANKSPGTPQFGVDGLHSVKSIQGQPVTITQPIALLSQGVIYHGSKPPIVLIQQIQLQP